MQKSQEKRDVLMELTPQILIVVLPLIFLGGFVDSVAGGGGLITLPAYLMAGIPAHLAMGTNKVVNGTGTALASFKYFRGGKVLLRPAIVSGHRHKDCSAHQRGHSEDHDARRSALRGNPADAQKGLRQGK